MEARARVSMLRAGGIVRSTQIERLLQAAQHAEAEHVDLEDAEGFEVVLVPFDDGAVLHRRVLDRHDVVQLFCG